MRRFLIFFIAMALMGITACYAQTTMYGIAGGGIKLTKVNSPEFMATAGFEVPIVDSNWCLYNRTQYFYTDAGEDTKEMQAFSNYLMVHKIIYSSLFAELGSGIMYEIEDGPDDPLAGFRAGLGLTLFKAVSVAANVDYIPIKNEPDPILVYLSVNLNK